MATDSSILGWRILWIEEAGYSPWDCKESDTTYTLLVIRCETRKSEKLEKTLEAGVCSGR